MKSNTSTNQKKIRFDRGAHSKYPASEDTHGRARVTLRSRSYYFGPYGSPESYVMYGAWLAELMRSGKAYLPSDRRNDAIDFIGAGLVKKSLPKPWIAAGMLASAVVLSIAAVSCAWIISSERESEVDGMVLTATELEYVRTMRSVDDIDGSHHSSDRVAETFKNAMEGLHDAPPPRISAKPPINSLD